MKQKALQVAKWAWVVLVFAAAILYVRNHYLDVLDRLRTLSISNLLLPLVFILLGKLMLVELSRRSVHSDVWSPSYREMFTINSITQLAKYIPGGIWQFVGRMGLYRAEGLSFAGATRAMLIENIWLVGSAVLTGAVIGFGFLPELFPQAGLPIDAPLLTFAVALVLLVLWFFGLRIIERFRVREMSTGKFWTLCLLGIQFASWVMMGLSFAFLIPGRHDRSFMLIALSGFILAWAGGYLTIFAPGGLGAREAILVGALSIMMAPEDAIVLAAIHRLIWVLAEILLGVLAALLPHEAVRWAEEQ